MARSPKEKADQADAADAPASNDPVYRGKASRDVTVHVGHAALHFGAHVWFHTTEEAYKAITSDKRLNHVVEWDIPDVDSASV